MSKKYSSLPKPVSAFDAALCSNVCKSFSAFYIYICVCCVGQECVCVCVCVSDCASRCSFRPVRCIRELLCVCMVCCMVLDVRACVQLVVHARCVAWSLMFAHQIQL